VSTRELPLGLIIGVETVAGGFLAAKSVTVISGALAMGFPRKYKVYFCLDQQTTELPVAPPKFPLLE
jgi:hypothetical protein